MTAVATSLAISMWGQRGVAYVTVVLTLLILIFAEITPKVYAKYYNERVSFFSAPILRFLMIALGPLSTAITWLSGKMLLLVGIDLRKFKRPPFTEAEIKAAIAMSWEDKTISPDEVKLLGRVFSFDDKTVADAMIPLKKMTTLEVSTPVDDIIETIKRTGYTRLPVTDKETQEIIGFLHAKDLFKLPLGKKDVSIRKILRPAYFVPADRTIDAQLRDFKANRLHQAVVLDAEGKVTGLITLEDVLEELVGHIEDETDRG
jgi:putative hemolysin